jgi:hypothetical protein
MESIRDVMKLLVELKEKYRVSDEVFLIVCYYRTKTKEGVKLWEENIVYNARK